MTTVPHNRMQTQPRTVQIDWYYGQNVVQNNEIKKMMKKTQTETRQHLSY